MAQNNTPKPVKPSTNEQNRKRRQAWMCGILAVLNLIALALLIMLPYNCTGTYDRGGNDTIVVTDTTIHERRITNEDEQVSEASDDIDEAVEEYAVRRAFTAQIIIDHVERRDGLHIDNVDEALNRAIDNGVKTLVVQPTHLMRGFEYDELIAGLAEYADAFEGGIFVGEPLLTSDDDCDRVADVMIDLMKDYDDGETAIVYMGHGTEHEANAVYAKMQGILADKGADNYYIGTVEAEPSVDDVLAAIAWCCVT